MRSAKPILFPTKTLGNGETCRRLQDGEAFKCPWCGLPMRPHDGPSAVVHCVPCQRSVDLWYHEPQVMKAEVTPYAPEMVVVDARTLEPIDPDAVWIESKEKEDEKRQG